MSNFKRGERLRAARPIAQMHRIRARAPVHRAWISLWACSLLATGGAHAQELTLDEAERKALQSDPVVNSQLANSQAYGEASIAGGTLPDPKLVLGAVNVPVDSFDLDQEPMTQVRVGVRQDFPRGSTLELRQQQSQWLSRSARAEAEDTRRKILRELRQTYLNLYYEVSALAILQESRKFFTKLVDITESNYAAGNVTQQDVVQASLELSRLDDRITKIRGMEESNRAELAQWIGDMAWQPLGDAFPALPDLPADIDLDAVIADHPLIVAQNAKVTAMRKKTDIARQDYKPGWSASLDYGFRSGVNADGSERPDFASALVSLDIPLFTANRQDRNVAAEQQRATAAQFEKDDRLRQLKRMYEKNRYQWQRLEQRAELYRNSLLATARDNTRASLSAYQSGVTEFNTLMRAQITELDVRLEDLRVRVDRAAAKARLLYITGEPSP